MGSREAVAEAIRKILDLKDEWDKEERTGWDEAHVRYGMVDPIIRALGWDTEDPRECHPEWPYPGGEGQVDYALFPEAGIGELARSNVAPVVIIEAKGFPENLDNHMEQLNRYAWAEPRMADGRVVLTNGVEWRLYEAGGRKVDLSGRRPETVHIIKDDVLEAAAKLYGELGRHRWR